MGTIIDEEGMHKDLIAFKKDLAVKFPGLRYTSGFRPGATTKSGNSSRHGKGEAWDIENNPEVYEYLYNTVEGAGMLNKYGLGILDETNPTTMKKTGATGKHFHIGKDSTLVAAALARFTELSHTVPKGSRLEAGEKEVVNNLVRESLERGAQVFADEVPPDSKEVIAAKAELTEANKEVDFKNKLSEILKKNAVVNNTEVPRRAPMATPFKTNVPENEFIGNFLPEVLEKGGTVDPPEQDDEGTATGRNFYNKPTGSDSKLLLPETEELDFMKLALEKYNTTRTGNTKTTVPTKSAPINTGTDVDLKGSGYKYEGLKELLEEIKSQGTVAPVSEAETEKIRTALGVPSIEEERNQEVDDAFAKKGLFTEIYDKDVNVGSILKKEESSKSTYVPELAEEQTLFTTADYENVGLTRDEIKVKDEKAHMAASIDETTKFQQGLIDEGYLEVQKATPKTETETRALQKFLIAEGYDIGEYGESGDGVDGKFGKRTKAALKTYNKDFTKLDGIYGDATAEAKFKRAGDQEVADRFFEFSTEEDIVKYQLNLENQGYFQGFDYNGATEDDITFINNDPEEYYKDGGEGRDPGCKFATTSASTSKDPRCTAFVGDELEKSIGVSRRREIGAYGDAWTISQNVINKGGTEVFSIFESSKPWITPSSIDSYMKDLVTKNRNNLSVDMFNEGDLVNLFYEGSGFKKEAFNDGTSKYFTTHTGIVKRDKSGNLVLEHNVGGNISQENLEDMVANRVKHGRNLDISIAAIIRPKYSESYYDSTEATVNLDVVKNKKNIGSKNAALFAQTIIKSKDNLMKDIPINGEEFSKLLKATKIIGWKESNYTTFNKYKPSFKGVTGHVREAAGFTERSRGYTQMKDKKNLTPLLQSKFIKKGGANLENPVEAGIPTFYSISSRYLYLKDLNREKVLDYSTDELVKLAILGWNEKINVVGKSMEKYKNYTDTIIAYNTNKDDKYVAHPYSLALEGYDSYLN